MGFDNRSWTDFKGLSNTSFYPVRNKKTGNFLKKSVSHYECALNFSPVFSKPYFFIPINICSLI